jgi:hypothetical protein
MKRCYLGCRELKLLGLGSRELRDQTENDDADEPHHHDHDRDPVQVALRDTRGTEVGGDAAAEHVGETATATAVKEDEKRQQETRKTEYDLQDDLENLHGSTFRTVLTLRTDYVRVDTNRYEVYRAAAKGIAAALRVGLGADVLAELRDAGELRNVETRAADECAVHVRLAQESSDVRRLD